MYNPQPNAIDYVEMPSTALDTTCAFFTQLFGWRFTAYGPEYSAFDDGRIAGGFYLAAKTVTSAEGGALIVLYAPELEVTMAKAQALGASLTKEIFAFPGGRRFQFLAPGAGEFAVWSDR